ncbi:hypothetical protein LTR85_011578 [Meristemomyces frigidus]|nr:hypothetical protein LTR85_011578 [Meristemomyces frigidus]
MAPHPHAPERMSTGGRWLPPKARGRNCKGSTVAFYCDGQRSIVATQVPPQAQLYKCFSVYHDRAIIWTVGFDASQNHVGDGIDNTAAAGTGQHDSDDEDEDADEDEEDDSDEDEDEAAIQTPAIDNPDWTTLTFRYSNNYVSYAGQRLEQQRLCLKNQSQDWATQLLPDTYRAVSQTSNTRYGGLNGELPLLLALVALSIPARSVAQYLPWCIANPWRVYPDTQVPRASGCE